MKVATYNYVFVLSIICKLIQEQLEYMQPYESLQTYIHMSQNLKEVQLMLAVLFQMYPYLPDGWFWGPRMGLFPYFHIDLKQQNPRDTAPDWKSISQVEGHYINIIWNYTLHKYVYLPTLKSTPGCSLIRSDDI